MTTPAQPHPRQSSDEWPAVVVALGILFLLGAVLVTAAARWTAADLKEVLSALAPVLGVITGAFVTYFFTRRANDAATSAAASAKDTAEKAAEDARNRAQVDTDRLQVQTERARALHNALTAAMSMVDDQTSAKLRQDRVISSVLDQA